MTKAIGLLSGGLDSTLAVRMMMEQGIDVVAVNFTSPFCTCTSRGCRHEASRIAEELDIDIKVIPVGAEYLRIVRKPKHGYGRNMNPCIDCRIFIFQKAGKIMRELGADFVFTGEVLGQRPMSQRMAAMKIIEKESGLEGLILRPLSAKHFRPTIPERKGVVDREKLLAIQGRGRKPQMAMAASRGMEDYHCPAGGCILTNREFADKLGDLLAHKKRVTKRDLGLLRIGRHFRSGRNKIIVGRDEKDNRMLMALKQKTDYVLEVPGCGSPVTLLQGDKNPKIIGFAASLTARYSDCQDNEITVKYGRDRPVRSIIVRPIDDHDLEAYRV